MSGLFPCDSIGLLRRAKKLDEGVQVAHLRAFFSLLSAGLGAQARFLTQSRFLCR